MATYAMNEKKERVSVYPTTMVEQLINNLIKDDFKRRFVDLGEVTLEYHGLNAGYEVKYTASALTKDNYMVLPFRCMGENAWGLANTVVEEFSDTIAITQTYKCYWSGTNEITFAIQYKADTDDTNTCFTSAPTEHIGLLFIPYGVVN